MTMKILRLQALLICFPLVTHVAFTPPPIHSCDIRGLPATLTCLFSSDISNKTVYISKENEYREFATCKMSNTGMQANCTTTMFKYKSSNSTTLVLEFLPNQIYTGNYSCDSPPFYTQYCPYPAEDYGSTMESRSPEIVTTSPSNITTIDLDNSSKTESGPTNVTSNNTGSSPTNETAIIVGVVIAFLLLLLGCVIGYFIHKRKANTSQNEALNDHAQNRLEEGRPLIEIPSQTPAVNDNNNDKTNNNQNENLRDSDVARKQTNQPHFTSQMTNTNAHSEMPGTDVTPEAIEPFQAGEFSSSSPHTAQAALPPADRADACQTKPKVSQPVIADKEIVQTDGARAHVADNNPSRDSGILINGTHLEESPKHPGVSNLQPVVTAETKRVKNSVQSPWTSDQDKILVEVVTEAVASGKRTYVDEFKKRLKEKGHEGQEFTPTKIYSKVSTLKKKGVINAATSPEPESTRAQTVLKQELLSEKETVMIHSQRQDVTDVSKLPIQVSDTTIPDEQDRYDRVDHNSKNIERDNKSCDRHGKYWVAIDDWIFESNDLLNSYDNEENSSLTETEADTRLTKVKRLALQALMYKMNIDAEAKNAHCTCGGLFIQKKNEILVVRENAKEHENFLDGYQTILIKKKDEFTEMYRQLSAQNSNEPYNSEKLKMYMQDCSSYLQEIKKVKKDDERALNKGLKTCVQWEILLGNCKTHIWDYSPPNEEWSETTKGYNTELEKLERDVQAEKSVLNAKLLNCMESKIYKEVYDKLKHEKEGVQKTHTRDLGHLQEKVSAAEVDSNEALKTPYKRAMPLNNSRKKSINASELVKPNLELTELTSDIRHLDEEVS